MTTSQPHRDEIILGEDGNLLPCPCKTCSMLDTLSDNACWYPFKYCGTRSLKDSDYCSRHTKALIARGWSRHYIEN